MIWCLAVGLTLLGTWFALERLGAPPPHLDAPFGLFPVTILKPLKGAEGGIRENLESFFHLDYPAYEILFSIAQEADPAGRVIRELMARFPQVPARLIVGDRKVGSNPKVNNMVQAYEEARYDWLLISDSNVRVEPAYVKRLVAHLEPGVGILTSIVAGLEPRGLGGQLESIYLNTFYARGMAVAFAFNQPCVVGKSMLFRKSTAQRFGGISTLSRYLAEDYVAGEAIRHLGLKVVLARDPIHQYIGEYSFREFWSRHIRWGRIRKNQSPGIFALEFLIGSVVSGALGAQAMSGWLGVPIPFFLALHFGVWGLCDYWLMRRLGQRITPAVGLAWVARELSWPLLWLHIVSGNSVNWRGQRLRLQAGGVLEG